MVDNGPPATPVQDDAASEARAQLLRLHLEVLGCPPSESRSLLLQEIELARDRLVSSDPTYAKHLCDQIVPLLGKLTRRSGWGLRTPESSVGVVLLGIALYSAFVLLVIGPCVVVVDSLSAGKTNTFTGAAQALGLTPLFETVLGLNVKPQSYLWGLIGGGGAVVSMVKRFEEIAKKPRSHFWVLFGQGVFNPIVGSLSAVVVCSFVYRTNHLTLLQVVPVHVMAFFAGFSERLLARAEAMLSGLARSRRLGIGTRATASPTESRSTSAAQLGSESSATPAVLPSNVSGAPAPLCVAANVV